MNADALTYVAVSLAQAFVFLNAWYACSVGITGWLIKVRGLLGVEAELETYKSVGLLVIGVAGYIAFKLAVYLI